MLFPSVTSSIIIATPCKKFQLRQMTLGLIIKRSYLTGYYKSEAIKKSVRIQDQARNGIMIVVGDGGCPIIERHGKELKLCSGDGVWDESLLM